MNGGGKFAPKISMGQGTKRASKKPVLGERIGIKNSKNQKNATSLIKNAARLCD